MSLTFKLLSLAIRTAAKPIGNYIKKQAKEHDGFRRFAVAQAQRVHRIDMRMRLGILHDPEAQQRMHDREQRAADEKKRQAETPIVRTEAEQKKHDEEQAKAEKEGNKKEEKPRKVQIRPLSEARAIELGANFFSEAFIFAVAAGLLVWDSWRSRRKESQRRDDVAERLLELESEVQALKSNANPESKEVSELIERIKASKRAKASWLSFIGWSQSSEDSAAEQQPKDKEQPKELEDSSSSSTPVGKTNGGTAEEAISKSTDARSRTDDLAKAVGNASTQTSSRTTTTTNATT